MSRNYIRNPLNYEHCLKMSQQYTNLKEFRLNHQKEYQTCHRKGWLDILNSLERSDKNLSKRCVYEYKFPDNSVYVGLTWNFELRHYNHMDYDYSKSAVYRHMNKTGLIPTYRIVLDYTDEDTASTFEEELREKYLEEGYNVLNKIRAGGLGGGRKNYSKSEIQEESLKYDNRKSFCTHSAGYYRSALKQGIIDEVCSHMKTTQEIQLYWNENRVSELIKSNNITSRGMLKKLNNNAYNSARRKGFLNKLLSQSIFDESNSTDIGTRKNFLTVIEKYKKKNSNGNNITFLKCVCDCGKECEVNISKFISNHSKSCGCLRGKRPSKDNYGPSVKS
jgi:hypothetical protein